MYTPRDWLMYFYTECTVHANTDAAQVLRSAPTSLSLADGHQLLLKQLTSAWLGGHSTCGNGRPLHAFTNHCRRTRSPSHSALCSAYDVWGQSNIVSIDCHGSGRSSAVIYRTCSQPRAIPQGLESSLAALAALAVPGLDALEFTFIVVVPTALSSPAWTVARAFLHEQSCASSISLPSRRSLSPLLWRFVSIPFLVPLLPVWSPDAFRFCCAFNFIKLLHRNILVVLNNLYNFIRDRFSHTTVLFTRLRCRGLFHSLSLSLLGHTHAHTHAFLLSFHKPDISSQCRSSKNYVDAPGPASAPQSPLRNQKTMSRYLLKSRLPP